MKYLLYISLVSIILNTSCSSQSKNINIQEPNIIVDNKINNGTLYRIAKRKDWDKGGNKWLVNGNERIHLKYIGEIKNNKPHGKGISYYPNGTTHEGEYENGKYNGFGIVNYKHGKFIGDTYEGQFQNGKKHGLGVYRWSDGRKAEGEFKNGKFWNLKLFKKNGNLKSKYVNGFKQ